MNEENAKLLLSIAGALDSLQSRLESTAEGAVRAFSLTPLRSRRFSAASALGVEDENCEVSEIDPSILEDPVLLEGLLNKMLETIDFQLRDRVRATSLRLASDEVYLRDVLSENDLLRKHSGELETKAVSVSGDIERLREEIAQRERAFNDLIHEYAGLEEQREKLEVTVKSLRVLTEEQKAQIWELQAEHESVAEHENKENRRKVEVLEKRLQGETARIKMLQGALAGAEGELNDVKETLVRKDKEASDLVADVQALKVELEVSQRLLEETQSLLQRVEDERDRAEKTAEHTADDLGELQHRYNLVLDRLKMVGERGGDPFGPDPFDVLKAKYTEAEKDRMDLIARLQNCTLELGNQSAIMEQLRISAANATMIRDGIQKELNGLKDEMRKLRREGRAQDDASRAKLLESQGREKVLMDRVKKLEREIEKGSDVELIKMMRLAQTEAERLRREVLLLRLKLAAKPREVTVYSSPCGKLLDLCKIPKRQKRPPTPWHQI